MNKFWIIALDVYKKNVRSISFLIMLLAPFLLMGIIYLAGSLASNFSSDTTIGIVTSDHTVSQALTKSKVADLSFKSYDSQKAAQDALKNEKIDGFMELDTTDNTVVATLYNTSSIGSTTELGLQQMLSQIQSTLRAQSLDISTEAAASLSQPATFSKTKVSFNDQGKMIQGEDNSAVQLILVIGITIVLFIFITSYSSIIAQEIASEKGTRIMEVILSSTKAKTHFYGKLTGVILVALTQIVVYVAAFSIGYTQLKKLDFVKSLLENFTLDKLFGPALWFTLLFFIFGILVYAVLAALCGSLVSKPEDTAKAVQPILYIGMIGYIIGFTFGTNDPQNIVIKVTSFIPLISSYVMPIRLATNTASLAQASISFLLLVLFGIGLTLFSANLYKSNVLVYSEKGMFQSLKESLTILANEKRK
ncbi:MULTISPECIES: ABC transporter permease [Enterococcus]|uniref:ABC transporter permease n=1 Tax=Enterococcus sulfureus ATCC 49903 TaxID=1140003 RepID=S0L358_9ENTE|nr:ABC transporter permease [Enterococcus sulfureus]EOT51399.1 ABC transporter permease [Enterococcus sulfureus ATCC 49903]EOT87056.1 ABC transporter permease [Enterococcus sulfureus ATCC 49903]